MNDEVISQKQVVDYLKKADAVHTYSHDDIGSAKLLGNILKKFCRFNQTAKEWYFFDGRCWGIDVGGLQVRKLTKVIAKALVKYAVNSVEDDEKYVKYATSWNDAPKRNNIINDAKDVNFFSTEDLDKNIFLLNVENGVLDLSDSENIKFLPHDADLLLSKICRVTYDENAQYPLWSKFLNDILLGDHDKEIYLQKICGMALTGMTKEEKFFLLYGEKTRNGKSVFCETIGYMLGDYAATMNPESLAVKQNKDSRQASGDIARLKGVRFVNASEPPKRMIFDVALVKTLTGRDKITARHLHEREFEFYPQFKLLINTNHLPQINDDTVFSSDRLQVITFDRHFEEDEQDKDLKDKLRQPQEMSGILNWCLSGLRLYHIEGLRCPQCVKNATAEYRSNSDKIGVFFEECMVQSSENCKAKDVYERYSNWTHDNGYGTESKGSFFSDLKSKGLLVKRATVKGMTCDNVIKGYELLPEDIPFICD
jgi:P4 family phage/plasmid primase-like protien